MTTAIQTATTGSVLEVTIDRPPVNALPPADWAALTEAIQSASDDTSIRSVIITGGSGRFCAGADIRVLTEPSDDPAMMLTIVADACAAIRDCRVPVIAAIEGAAHGGGLELALACDIRVAHPEATFAASGVNMGLVASVQSLVQAVGDTRARLMLFTGQRFDAGIAASWSIVTLTDNDPLDAAREVAGTIAGKAPLAIEANKKALAEANTMSGDSHRELMTTLFAELTQTNDHQEAINAFLEKRPRDFNRS